MDSSGGGEPTMAFLVDEACLKQKDRQTKVSSNRLNEFPFNLIGSITTIRKDA
jgi:hypothetical protein